MIPFLQKFDSGFRIWETRKLGFPSHLHHHIELVLFLDNEAVAYADTERCVLHSRDAFISFPNQVHRFDPPYTNEHSIVLSVDPDTIPELSSHFFNSLPTSAHLVGFVTDEILAIARRLFELIKPTSPLDEIERHALLCALFSRILASCTLAESHESDSPAFRAVVDYCSRHYKSDITLALLEQELHISRYHISHMFSKKLGIGFNNYINSLRISRACRYLTRDDRSITEISSLVGFSNPRTFNRAFLKHMGMTPSEYRK